MDRVDPGAARRRRVDRPSRQVERLIDRRVVRWQIDREPRARRYRDVHGPDDAEPAHGIDPAEQPEVVRAWL